MDAAKQGHSISANHNSAFRSPRCFPSLQLDVALVPTARAEPQLDADFNSTVDPKECSQSNAMQELDSISAEEDSNSDAQHSDMFVPEAKTSSDVHVVSAQACISSPRIPCGDAASTVPLQPPVQEVLNSGWAKVTEASGVQTIKRIDRHLRDHGDGDLIAPCGQGKVKEAMKQDVRADAPSFFELIAACNDDKLLEELKKIHDFYLRSPFCADLQDNNKLLEMYSKWRSMKDAHRMFDGKPDRNRDSWHLMINGYASNSDPYSKDDFDSNLKKLAEVVQKRDKVPAEVSILLHLLESTNQEQQRELYKARKTGSLPRNDLIGRGKDKELVMQWSLKPSNEHLGTDLYRNISLLSIVGHGGMGKTTLLQHVYEDEKTKECDLKMWVCASNKVGVKKIITDMLEPLSSRRMNFEELCAATNSPYQLEVLEGWEQMAMKAFEYFEQEGNRVITVEELEAKEIFLA